MLDEKVIGVAELQDVDAGGHGAPEAQALGQAERIRAAERAAAPAAAEQHRRPEERDLVREALAQERPQHLAAALDHDARDLPLPERAQRPRQRHAAATRGPGPDLHALLFQTA